MANFIAFSTYFYLHMLVSVVRSCSLRPNVKYLTLANESSLRHHVFLLLSGCCLVLKLDIIQLKV